VNRRPKVAAALAACVLGLAACSPGQQPAAPPPPPAATPTPQPTTALAAPVPAARITDVAQLSPVCPLLDGTQVGARFGRPPASGIEGQAARLENGAEATQCTYVAGDSPVAVLTVSIGRGSTMTPDVMIEAIQRQTGAGEPITGVGGAALYYTQGEAAILTSANPIGGTPVLVSISGPASIPRMAYEALLTPLVSRF